MIKGARRKLIRFFVIPRRIGLFQMSTSCNTLIIVLITITNKSKIKIKIKDNQIIERKREFHRNNRNVFKGDFAIRRELNLNQFFLSMFMCFCEFVFE